ncbi:hypothetical protein OHA21_11625 [Actinoplanes sp. NBC_00393]|uniref:hypothetical protein n=1 Tax=Actinoplanes sp. NBC_00393 TaxID=2975953 RepID=UPI002E226ED3
MTVSRPERADAGRAGVHLLRSAGFALLYLIASYIGRLTVMDETNLSLVWPAAGVAAI